MEGPKREGLPISRVSGSLNATISGKTEQVSRVFAAIMNQVCLTQNGFFWNPRVVLKFVEASLRL